MAFIVLTLLIFGGLMMWLVRRGGPDSRNEPGGGDSGVPPMGSAGSDVFLSDTPAGSSASCGDSGTSGGDGGSGGGDGGGGGD